MTRRESETHHLLEQQGLRSVIMPVGIDTPIPGLCLMADHAHTRLLMLVGDGSYVDLLEVYHRAKRLVDAEEDDPEHTCRLAESVRGKTTRKE